MGISVHQLAKWKHQGQRITVLTAWDYITGQIADQAGADVVLVGDSLAMVALGHATTLPLTLDAMIHHAQAVRRGVQQALLVVDLPFMSYQASPEDALRSAGRILQETGANAVKLEGGYGDIIDTVKRLVQAGIPVMGHVGLTPQSIHQLGSLRQRGVSPAEAETILESAIALQGAGAFCVILEHIPSDLAHKLSQRLAIPTIGIGAGSRCDGQVLVTADVLGLSNGQPPFAKAYADLRQAAVQAAQQFCQDVRLNQFPEE